MWLCDRMCASSWLSKWNSAPQPSTLHRYRFTTLPAGPHPLPDFEIVLNGEWHTLQNFELFPQRVEHTGHRFPFFTRLCECSIKVDVHTPVSFSPSPAGIEPSRRTTPPDTPLLPLFPLFPLFPPCAAAAPFPTPWLPDTPLFPWFPWFPWFPPFPLGAFLRASSSRSIAPGSSMKASSRAAPSIAS